MSRHVDDFDGCRQMVALQVPGDFVDLHAYPLKTLDHDVATLTAVRLAIVPHAALSDIQHNQPELARKLWFLTLLDAAMHRKWIYRLGRLKAAARIAHFLCETVVRLAAVGLSDGRQFHLPLTQFDLGEICGMTSVHVNRVLRELREAGLCTFRNQQVEIHDWHGLAKAGAFEPGYLYLDDATTHRFSGAHIEEGCVCKSSA
ncbi:Crp/Fnr family transcriptional regulator [Ottowia thiooxydans]|uniref:Crp/Fnr family transcriptional regulator n=1 Tax=Ottowia thiooxydans TaxID=219182 RepID=UPI001B7FCDE9|nr:Crp/Fnr family transcriptional regulator [Ottowia thiooxydans]